MSDRPRLVVFGYGNPSRGDDALGPALMERLEALRAGDPGLEDVRLVADFQLQVEHALDLVDRDLVLFMDASVSCRPPFVFEEIAPREDASYSTHALSPWAVLHVYGRVRHVAPPPAFLLSVRGHSFELGEALGAEASRHLEDAWELVQELVAHGEVDAWRRRVSSAPEAHR